jgi:hypothetical protein
MTRDTGYVRGGWLRQSDDTRASATPEARVLSATGRPGAGPPVSADVGSAWIGVLEHLDRAPAIRSPELAES